MLRFPALALSSVLLIGCATQPTDGESTATQDTTGKTEATASVPEKPFPADSLYDLLVAEFALRRQAYDVTLEKYTKQAPTLRDAGVSAHTTHLAQFLQRPNEALKSAQLWVELDPKNAEANNTVASLLAQRGQSVAALPYLVVVEEQTGEANFPMLLSGFSQLQEQQRDALVQGIDNLAKEYPQNTRLLLTQALIHAENAQFELALDELQTLLELEPDQPQAVLLEARILLEQNADEPYERLQRLLQDNPDAKRLRLEYAKMLTTTDIAAAREQFEILSEQSPRDGDLLFSLALVSREMGDNVAAQTYLQQTIALGQRADEAHYYLGRMAEDDANPEEAIRHYSEVAVGTEYLAANSRIGVILVEQKQIDRSHAYFKAQRELNPELREQLYALEADILSRAKASRESMRLLNQALQEMPSSTTLRYSRAMLSEQMDDLESMERDLRTILAGDPDNATALNALGYTLADRTTRYAEALELVSRALALQPNEPAILDSMGWVLFRNGQYDESLTYLSRAYAEFPDPEVAAHLGEVLWMNGDTEDAKAVWQTALRRDPQNPILLKTLRRLGVELTPTTPPDIAPQQQTP
ncbi:Beta-barrel assembly-enhancing protease [Halioglobus japonicus]|nr:Beta-barrel assembly-enhancing protease [Halioglobus japonicus]